jgi:hypothetical protein
MEEEWFSVPDHPLLRAARSGAIKTIDRQITNRAGRLMNIPGALLAPKMHTNGYLRVEYKHLGVRVRLYVHRVIARTFVDGWTPNATVDHLNFDRLNNATDNLEWVSVQENSRRQCAAGRGRGIRGEAHHRSRISDADAARIPAMRKTGMTLAAIADELSVAPTTVWHRINPRWAQRDHAAALPAN